MIEDLRGGDVIKKLIYYVCWTVIISVLFYLGARYQTYLKMEASKTFKLEFLLYYMTIFPILMGLILRLPAWILEFKRHVAWSFDWMKFLGVGIPALYFAVIRMLATTSLGMYLPFAETMLLIDNAILSTTAGIVFGYVLLSCIQKKSETETNLNTNIKRAQ